MVAIFVWRSNRAGRQAGRTAPATGRPTTPSTWSAATCAACIVPATDLVAGRQRRVLHGATPQSGRGLSARHGRPAIPTVAGSEAAGHGDPALDDPDEFARLWRGFMTARVTLGLVLLALQASLFALGQSSNPMLIMVCGAYLAATLGTRLVGKPRRLGPHNGAALGVHDRRRCDHVRVAAVCAGAAGINYSPLLALPVLLAAVLGSLATGHGHGGRRDAVAAGPGQPGGPARPGADIDRHGGAVGTDRRRLFRHCVPGQPDVGPAGHGGATIAPQPDGARGCSARSMRWSSSR